jgi:hypothetical protein
MRLEKSELEFIGCIRDLARAGRFEGAGLGIAKQVISAGQSSLNDRQRQIFDTALDKMIVEKCPVCQRFIPWSEMALVIEHGACAACRPKAAV